MFRSQALPTSLIEERLESTRRGWSGVKLYSGSDNRVHWGSGSGGVLEMMAIMNRCILEQEMFGGDSVMVL